MCGFFFFFFFFYFFFFQAEDGIRDLVRSRGLGDVYKRQIVNRVRQKLIEAGFVDVEALTPYDPEA